MTSNASDEALLCYCSTPEKKVESRNRISVTNSSHGATPHPTCCADSADSSAAKAEAVPCLLVGCSSALLAPPRTTHTPRLLNTRFGRNQGKKVSVFCLPALQIIGFLPQCAPPRRYFPTRIHVSRVRLIRGSRGRPQPECLWRECPLAHRCPSCSNVHLRRNCGAAQGRRDSRICGVRISGYWVTCCAARTHAHASSAGWNGLQSLTFKALDLAEPDVILEKHQKLGQYMATPIAGDMR